MEKFSKAITFISQICHLKNSHFSQLDHFNAIFRLILNLTLSKTKSWPRDTEQLKCHVSDIVIDFIFLSRLVDLKQKTVRTEH